MKTLNSQPIKFNFDEFGHFLRSRGHKKFFHVCAMQHAPSHRSHDQGKKNSACPMVFLSIRGKKLEGKSLKEHADFLSTFQVGGICCIAITRKKLLVSPLPVRQIFKKNAKYAACSCVFKFKIIYYFRRKEVSSG